MKHTPGPWTSNEIGTKPEELACAVWAGDVPICTTEFSIGRYKKAGTRETRHANARLIASSPDLLNALTLAQATIERLSTTHGPFNSAQGTLDVIAAAIQKAAGGEEQS